MLWTCYTYVMLASFIWLTGTVTSSEHAHSDQVNLNACFVLICLLQSWSRSQPPPQSPTYPSLSSSTAGTSGRTCVCLASRRKSTSTLSSCPVLTLGLTLRLLHHFSPLFSALRPQIHLSRHQSLLQLFQGWRQRHGPQLLLDIPAICVCRGWGLAVAVGNSRQVRPPWHPAPLHDDDRPGLSDPPGAHGV